MKPLKILLAFAAGSFVLGSLAMAANAASWPNRPIHLIVPYPPGGGTDLLARVIGAQLEKSLGQAIVIDNRPGGSTVIGTDVLANARPHTRREPERTSEPWMRPGIWICSDGISRESPASSAIENQGSFVPGCV